MKYPVNNPTCVLQKSYSLSYEDDKDKDAKGQLINPGFPGKWPL